MQQPDQARPDHGPRDPAANTAQNARLTQQSPAPCAIEHQSIHGTDDRLVSYESGEESILEYTQNVIGCVDTPVVRVKRGTRLGCAP